MLMTRTTPYLDPDVFGNLSACDERPYELELCIARGWIGDLDLLEAALYQMLEEQTFLFGRHRSCKRLIAVTKVSGEPDGMLLDTTSRPLSVRDVKGDIRGVFVAWVNSVKVSYVLASSTYTMVSRITGSAQHWHPSVCGEEGEFEY